MHNKNRPEELRKNESRERVKIKNGRKGERQGTRAIGPSTNESGIPKGCPIWSTFIIRITVKLNWFQRVHRK